MSITDTRITHIHYWAHEKGSGCYSSSTCYLMCGEKMSAEGVFHRSLSCGFYILWSGTDKYIWCEDCVNSPKLGMWLLAHSEGT
jgi:hypothetical protein